MSKKRNKFRANVKPFADCDYKKGVKNQHGELVIRALNKEELDFYEKFENEYYCNTINREGSLHKEILNDDDFERCKKETFAMNNSQNRDIYGIAATSEHYLTFIDDDNNFVEPAAPETISKIQNPNYAFNVFLNQTIDEINNGGRELEVILIEYGQELVKLGASLRKDRINTAIKRSKK